MSDTLPLNYHILTTTRAYNGRSQIPFIRLNGAVVANFAKIVQCERDGIITK